MNEMFEQCNSIKSLNLSSFNTEKVVNISKMFYSCTSLENLDLSSFNLKNCINYQDMFGGNTNQNLLYSINNN